MTAHNFSAAVRYSVAANRPPMIRACYHWLKRVGVEEWRERKAGGRGEKRDERRKVRIDTGALDAVGDIVGGGDGTEQINVNIKVRLEEERRLERILERGGSSIPPMPPIPPIPPQITNNFLLVASLIASQRVKFDTAKDEFVCQASGRCSMGIFRTILDDEKKRRSIHFHPGCSSYPVDRSKLEVRGSKRQQQISDHRSLTTFCSSLRSSPRSSLLPPLFASLIAASILCRRGGGGGQGEGGGEGGGREQGEVKFQGDQEKEGQRVPRNEEVLPREAKVRLNEERSDELTTLVLGTKFKGGRNFEQDAPPL